MTALKNVALPLTESRALVERGIVLETALYWFRFTSAEDRIINDGYSVSQSDGEYYAPVKRVCPAPVLSELLDAIRAKHPESEFMDTTITTFANGETWLNAAWRTPVRKREQHRAIGGKSPLLAAAALLMEVSK